MEAFIKNELSEDQKWSSYVVFMDNYAGFISGGVSTGVAGSVKLIANSIDQNQSYKALGEAIKGSNDAQNFIDFAVNMDSEAVSKALGKNTVAEKMSAKSIGKVAVAVQSEINAKFSKAQSNTDVISVAKELLGSTNSKVVGEIVTKAVFDAVSNHPEWSNAADTTQTENADRSVDSDVHDGYNDIGDVQNDLNSTVLSYEEESALLAYKSSESYKINAKLRESVELGDSEQAIVNGLDSGLRKLPVYKGKVYRNIQFDGLGDQAARDEFVSSHVIGDRVLYEGYTSSSTEVNGYVLDGDFVVHFEIESVNGKDLEGYGNNFESEVLFPRDTFFVVKNIKYDSSGTPTIYLTEVRNNESSGVSGQEDSGDFSGNNRGQQKKYSESHTSEVQRLSKDDSGNVEMRTVSRRNSDDGIKEQRNLQGVQAEGDENLKSNIGASEADSNESASFMPESESVVEEIQFSDSGVTDSFGITKLNDYVHVQKQVICTLKNEGFFTDEGGASTTVTNNDSGMVVEVNARSIKETLNDKNYRRVSRKLKIAKLATIRNIPSLIEKGHLLSDNVINAHNSESSVSYAYIESKVSINGKPANVRIAIRKSPQKNKFWVHMIDIKNDGSLPAGTSKDSKTGYQTSVDEDTVSQDDDFVKENDIDQDTDVENDDYAKDESFWTADNTNEDAKISKTLKEKLASLFGIKSDTKGPVSIGEIVKLIEKEFDVPVSTGRFKQRAYGIYKNKTRAIRTIKTMAETAIAIIGTNAIGITDVNWIGVGSACLLSGVVTVLTCIKGLPEIKE